MCHRTQHFIRDFTIFKTLKEKCIRKCLLKSPAANNCLTLLRSLSIEANNVDPDQTFFMKRFIGLKSVKYRCIAL